MATEIIVGTPGNDMLFATAGTNEITGGAGNDVIDATQGTNVIDYATGDGIDLVGFSLPRTYQYADYLQAAQQMLSQIATGSEPTISSSFFSSSDFGLMDALPFEISTVLNQFRDDNPVSTDAAQTALSALVDWIQTPVSNVVAFGPDITLADVTVQLGSTTSFNTPSEISISVNGQQGMLFEYKGVDASANSAGAALSMPISFQFADGQTMTLDQLLATRQAGSIGTQFGTDGNDRLTGSLTGDTIYGLGGNDFISAGAGNDTVDGGAGDDVIDGGAGADMINGGDGDDVIAVGQDGGMATGGAGNDVYVFNAGDGVLSIDNQGAVGDMDTLSLGRIDPASITASVNPSSGILTLQISDNDQINLAWFDPFNDMAENPSQVISRVQFIDGQGHAQVFDLAAIVHDLIADPTNSGVVQPFADATHRLYGSELLAGGDAAIRYATTGELMAAPNLAPVAAGIATQAAQEDSAFAFTIPAGSFTDPEGAALAFTASAADGSPLPSWLTFDAATRTFSGTPANGDVGTLAVQVSAMDPGGLAVAQTFDIVVANTNDAPTASAGTLEASATQDQAFALVLPAGTFADVDAGDSLRHTATLADGSALPAWLTFDANTMTLSGTPGNADVGSLAINVVATDTANATAIKTIDLSVANVNDAPVLASAIGAQSATEDAAFTFVVPDTTFADIDAGDSLSLSAKLADGSALPSWLTFDAATRTFSGTPLNADVGWIDVRVTATDLAGASVSDVFSIAVANTNDAPVVASAIAAQNATEDAAFTFVVPDTTFADVDGGDSLSLSAKLADGSALPSWLTFDAATRTFSGTPLNADVGSIDVRVTATDLAGASVSDVFSIAVANTNDAPTLAQPIAAQSATEDAPFSFMIPQGTFADVDAADALTLSATLADGSALPGWLAFDAATGTFSGTPANADVGSVSIMVTARDLAGASAVSTFQLGVANTNDAPVVVTPAPAQQAVAGEAFSMIIPTNTFQDVDVGDTLTFNARMGNGDNLPAWLSFDAATRTLSSTASVAGSFSVAIVATDAAGATAVDVFALNVDAPVLSGDTGGNLLAGDDDVLHFERDGEWGKHKRREVSDSGARDRVQLSGKNRSTAVYDGGAGNDTLLGTGKADAILLDDDSTAATRSGPRIVGIERIDAGGGDDVVDLTSRRYTYGDVTVAGGSGNDVIWSSAGNDVLRGGTGNDRLDGNSGSDYLDGGTGNDVLRGGRGIDVLQGGAGNDRLTDTSGNGVLDGGSGSDTLINGADSALLIGGKGSDTLVLGGGYDVIAFNRGDGKDTVKGQAAQATLSLGGGIRHQDLTLSRDGSALVLEDGAGDRITFDKWYDGKRYQSVSRLQIVDHAPQAGDGGGSTTVETFDFQDVVHAFDGATSSGHGVSRWALTNALAEFQLTSSNGAALGGDLAVQYGISGSLAGVAMSAAREIAGSAQFGKQAQPLQTSQPPQDPAAVTLS